MDAYHSLLDYVGGCVLWDQRFRVSKFHHDLTKRVFVGNVDYSPDWQTIPPSITTTVYIKDRDLIAAQSPKQIGDLVAHALEQAIAELKEMVDAPQ